MEKYIKQSLIFTFVCLLLSLTSCKDDDSPIYELRFTNTSSNPYKVEIDGKSNVLSGNSFIDYDLEQGNYYWKVTQQSGYLFYPTTQDGNVNLNKDKNIVFP